MGVAPSEAWFGRRRPWLWLGASCGVCAALALGSWWFAARSAHAAVETERARIGAQVTLSGGRTEVPAPDALAQWIEVLEQLPPDSYYETQWPDDDLGTAPAPYRLIPGLGFVVHANSALEARFAMSAAAPADCSEARPEDHPGGVEGWLAEHVGQPAQEPQLRDCLRALLRERIGSANLHPHALAARRLPRADGAAWLARMELADQASPEPALRAVPAVVRHLGVLAALAALEHDALRAREALDAAYTLCESLAGLPWHAAYETWVECELMSVHATVAVLAQAPEAVDEERLVRHLEGLDAQGRHVAACELQRTLCDRAYARLLAGKPCGVDAFDLSPETPGARAPWLERERADALASWRRCADWSREPLAARGAPPLYERHPLASDDHATLWLAATRPVSNEVLARLESFESMLRIALVARRDGIDAAKAEASRRAASASGRTIEVRAKPAGLLVEAPPALASSSDLETLRIYLPSRK